MRLEGRRIIVTDAGRGMGTAIARGLAERGARIVVASSHKRNADNVADDIRNVGGDAIALSVDVSDRGSVQAMVATAVHAYGGVDVIFNNASDAKACPFLDIREDDWRRAMDVNALGALMGMQEAARHMIAQGHRGKLINIASIADRRSESLAHYSAGKFAVIALTQAGARAFARHGITANAICPGGVAGMRKEIGEDFGDHGLVHLGAPFKNYTAAIPLERASLVTDLVSASAFLASPDSDYMTGQTLIIDGDLVEA